MGAKYNDASERLAARIQHQREHDSAKSPVQMSVDNGARRAGEWQRARRLLVGNFAHDENRENPPVQVATPQVRDGAGWS
jgi:hypothetical protein